MSASMMKAEMQVKRRRQALHQDMVTLEEQQVDGEGETYGAGRFLCLFFLIIFLPAFFKATRTSLSVFVCWCAVCVCSVNVGKQLATASS